MKRTPTALVLGLLIAVQAAVLAFAHLAVARAADPGAAPAPAPTAATAPPAWQCRMFPRDLDKDRTLDTSDGVTEIGQWVGPLETSGWRVASIDLEIGQKSTGYPQGWVQICLTR